MSCIVAMIMMRTIRRDLQRYEQLLVDGGAAGVVDVVGAARGCRDVWGCRDMWRQRGVAATQ